VGGVAKVRPLLVGRRPEARRVPKITTHTVPSAPSYHAYTVSYNTGRTRTVVPVYGYGDQP
jgi:hypothetical protein